MVGLYGGNSSHGANKNEDGALFWTGADWVFAAVSDAHASAESTDAALELLAEHKSALLAIMMDGQASSSSAVTDLFSGAEGRECFGKVRAETACFCVLLEAWQGPNCRSNEHWLRKSTQKLSI